MPCCCPWKDLGHPASEGSNLAGRLPYLKSCIIILVFHPPSLRTPFWSRGTLPRGPCCCLGCRARRRPGVIGPGSVCVVGTGFCWNRPLPGLRPLAFQAACVAPRVARYGAASLQPLRCLPFPLSSLSLFPFPPSPLLLL